MKTKIVLLFLAFGFSAWAQNTNNPQHQTSSTDGRNTRAQVVQPGTISNSAAKSRDENQMGAIVGTVVTTGLQIGAAINLSRCPEPGSCALGAALLVMSVLAQQQTDANKHAGGAAGNTNMQVDGAGWGGSGYNPQGAASINAEAEKILGKDKVAAGQSAKKALQTTGIGGYKLDPKKKMIITPDGKQIPVGSLSTPEGLSKAGISPSAMKYGMEKAKKLEDEAMKKVTSKLAGFDEGGGGSSAQLNAKMEEPSLDLGSDPSSAGAGQGGSAAQDQGRNLASVAGLTKTYNGDPIGVSRDDIFQMMTRRYKVKEKQDAFFAETEFTSPGL